MPRVKWGDVKNENVVHDVAALMFDPKVKWTEAQVAALIPLPVSQLKSCVKYVLFERGKDSFSEFELRDRCERLTAEYDAPTPPGTPPPPAVEPIPVTPPQVEPIPVTPPVVPETPPPPVTHVPETPPLHVPATPPATPLAEPVPLPPLPATPIPRPPPRSYDNGIKRRRAEDAAQHQAAVHARRAAHAAVQARRDAEEAEMLRVFEAEEDQRRALERQWAEYHARSDRMWAAEKADAEVRAHRARVVTEATAYENARIEQLRAVWPSLHLDARRTASTQSAAVYASLVTAVVTDQVQGYRANPAAWTLSWHNYVDQLLAAGGLPRPISSLIFPDCPISRYSSEQLVMVNSVAARYGY